METTYDDGSSTESEGYDVEPVSPPPQVQNVPATPPAPPPQSSTTINILDLLALHSPPPISTSTPLTAPPPPIRQDHFVIPRRKIPEIRKEKDHFEIPRRQIPALPKVTTTATKSTGQSSVQDRNDSRDRSTNENRRKVPDTAHSTMNATRNFDVRDYSSRNREHMESQHRIPDTVHSSRQQNFCQHKLILPVVLDRDNGLLCTCCRRKDLPRSIFSKNQRKKAKKRTRKCMDCIYKPDQVRPTAYQTHVMDMRAVIRREECYPTSAVSARESASPFVPPPPPRELRSSFDKDVDVTGPTRSVMRRVPRAAAVRAREEWIHPSFPPGKKPRHITLGGFSGR